jgi:hypothetical protein
MTNILAEVLEETEKRIRSEMLKHDKTIKDFVAPIKIPLSQDEKHKYIDERINGRLSTANLQKAFEAKSELEKQLHEIANFKYRFASYLE